MLSRNVLSPTSTLAFVLLILTTACVSTPHQTFKGWVSDAHCTIQHVGGANPECVRMCVRGGAGSGHPEWPAQALVLVEDETDRVFVIDNPDALPGLEAQHVAVKGRLRGARLHVDAVERLAR